MLSLGDVTLQSGARLLNATLSYASVGQLNAARDNAVVMPTYFTGRSDSYAPLIGPGKSLDPDRYFIIIPDMIGNGLSSSPSNYRSTGSFMKFPGVTIHDNVVQQGRLVFDHLGVSEVALVTGWSMGGMQAYQWAVSYPDRVRRLLPYGSAARTSPYNWVFLAGLKSALRADPDWDEVECPAVPKRGIAAFVRLYVGWAYSELFFREGKYRQLGYATIDELFAAWDDEHQDISANDLMAMLETWSHADIGAGADFGDSVERALSAIRARTMIVGCASDRYFSPLENRYEAGFIGDCDVRMLDSPFGHCAFSPGRNAEATAFLDRCLGEVLRSG